jgi:hypothetical protein
MAIYTDITVLVDRSGSMATIQKAMENAFGEFLTKHKEVPSTKLTLIQFDTADAQDIVYTARPVCEADKLSINPRGGTPLLDAMCMAIDSTGRRLASMKESARPDQVLFIVITDGEENSSKMYTRSDVKSRVTHQQSNYNWQFIYLGANQDAFAEAESFGIGKQWTLNYKASHIGTVSMGNSLAGATSSYTLNSEAERGKLRGFTKQEREAAVEGTVTTT